MSDRKMLRSCIRGAYDLQKLRITAGQRLVANWYSKEGRHSGKKIDAMDAEAKDMVKRLKESYKLITNGIVAQLKKSDSDSELPEDLVSAAAKLPKIKDFKGDKLISDFTEFAIVDSYVNLERQEYRQMKSVEKLVHEHPIWTEFLQHVKGCGFTMTAVIISEIDIHKTHNCGSIWMLAGLDVGPDGRGRSRRAEHLVDREYIAKDGKKKIKKSITYNPFLKTKMVGVLADCIIKAGKGQKYRKIYDDYKHRMLHHKIYGEKMDGKEIEGKGIMSKGRRHRMAMRYMTKIFLQDLYVAWCKIEGITPEISYRVEKLCYEDHDLDLNLDNAKAVDAYEDFERQQRKEVWDDRDPYELDGDDTLSPVAE